VLRKKNPEVSLCPLHIPYGVSWDLGRTFTMNGLIHVTTVEVDKERFSLLHNVTCNLSNVVLM